MNPLTRGRVYWKLASHKEAVLVATREGAVETGSVRGHFSTREVARVGERYHFGLECYVPLRELAVYLAVFKATVWHNSLPFAPHCSKGTQGCLAT